MERFFIVPFGFTLMGHLYEIGHTHPRCIPGMSRTVIATYAGWGSGTIGIFICGCRYRGLLLYLPAPDVKILPSTALRRCLTHERAVLGLDRHQIAPLMETVFSGKVSQLGQNLCVDPVKERILIPLAPIQPLKALAIR